jgi:hypothetical protein
MAANDPGRGLVYMTEGPSSSNPYANHRMEIIELGQGAQ